MRIAIASDHAGYALKEALKKHFSDMEWEDFGAYDPSPVDYPKTGFAAAKAVARKDCEKGILVCGTGIGMSLVANRVHGVRAALCVNTEYAELSRRHNNANVLCLPARFMATEHAYKVVEKWLNTPFEGGRHAGRVELIENEDVSAL